jgi:hypothetical protein
MAGENSSQSFESDNDYRFNNSDVVEILKSDQSERFMSDILSIKNPEQILRYLKKSQDEGKLTFGRQEQFSDPEGAYIIIVDEKQIYAVLLFYNSEYFDTTAKQTYNSLSENFRGKRSIWIKLL